MASITLTRGMVAIIDDADLVWALQWKWLFDGQYAVRSVKVSTGKWKHISLHRALLTPPDDIMVDHINGNKLDNRRANLRLATKAENQYNKAKQHTSASSQYKGVSYRRTSRYHKKRWHAAIYVNYRCISLGDFMTEIEAALAYDIAAQQHFGEYARLNFPVEKK